MTKRQILPLLIGCVLLLLLATPAFAGGWAVVTVDELPPSLRTGEPMTLGFMVRQHGQHPINLDRVVLTATPLSGGATLTFTAHQEGAEGHYIVEVLLPKAGTWEWTIQPDWFAPVPMVPLTVLDTTVTAPRPLDTLLPWAVAGLGAVTLSGAILSPGFSAHRLRVPAGLLGVAGVAGGLGWLSMGTPLPSAVAAQPIATVAYGQALFVAKGCNTCHLHADALNTWSTESGPNLTNYQKNADYLRVWLKDPQATKPNTEMPNLMLKENEIEMLAAFLTQGQQ